MHQLTAEGRRIVDEVARRHGVSEETVAALLAALVAGQGGQAQFNIAELGGMGQWSRGGMTMVGDMFNHGLKARVDALCSELSGLVGGAQILGAGAIAIAEPGSWRQPVRRRAGRRDVVAGRARRAVVHRRAERPALRGLPAGAAAGDRPARAGDGLRHRRPPDRRGLAAAERRPVAELHQPARPGAGRGPARGGRRRGRAACRRAADRRRPRPLRPSRRPSPSPSPSPSLRSTSPRRPSRRGRRARTCSPRWNGSPGCATRAC